MITTAHAPRPRGRTLRALALAAGAALALTACTGQSTTPDDDTDAGDPQTGGALTVLLDAGYSGAWATGLDPATSNTTGANLPQNAAIFGGLFTLEADDDGSNARIEPNQAESYEWGDDGLTLTITLREGLEFSDGTPFDSEAVLWNWIRELSSGSTGAPTLDLNLELEPQEHSDEFMDSLWAALPEDVDQDTVNARLGALRTVDDRTLEMHFNTVNGALVNGFPSTNMNLIASPTAYEELGAEQFSVTPVAAGPFVVEQNRQNERLHLVRNDSYFKDGLPYLDELTFQAITGDQVMYQTLLSGQGDVIEGMSSTTLIAEAQNNPAVEVYLGAPTSPYVVQLNTRKPPFDDKKAREAIYYATDFASINEGLFKGEGEMTQSFTASGGLFYQAEVEGYREYDPDKAAELVDELGGLTVELGTTDTGVASNVATALQTQWAEAGIDVSLDAKPLGDVITKFTSGEWESMLQTAGAWEPAAGIGVAVRFGSTSPFSGTPLPDGATSAQDAISQGLLSPLDQMLRDAVGTIDEDEREAYYADIAKTISDEAYAPFGMAFSPAQVVRTGVHGPGLTTPIPALAVNSGVLYDRVWVEQ
ncbi:ABC transporter substrate-binding protein [Microbacterium marinilacus]|uniref:ABC transporter substrate-binding protein n=1 Tax=Microbacterium marinilacus TaxID=415209 RepID=A0ABP7BKB6_9MICO|nr:ABC transporter substrate-binding protein [Microbacterium marinilacus]MBY0688399.1 ABC transporter substrate-binding protein [Microbacterium marinilacus]